MILEIRELTNEDGKKEIRCFIELVNNGNFVNIDMTVKDYFISQGLGEETIAMPILQYKNARERQNMITTSNLIYKIKV